MIQRIALWATVGAVLPTVGATWDTWQFWSILALFWASEHMTRTELLLEIQQRVAQWEAANKDNKDIS